MAGNKRYEVETKIVEAYADYTWGYVNGFGGATGILGDDIGYRDWKVAKIADGSNDEASLSTVGKYIDSVTDATTYFSFGAFNGTNKIWLAVPIAVSGYRTFRVNITSSLNTDQNIYAYLVPNIDGLIPSNIATSLFAHTILTAEPLSTSGFLEFGPGGKDLSVFYAGPQGYLLIKFVDVAGPTSGNLRVGIERQK